MIKEFNASAPSPIGDSALAALYQASTQNTDFTPFRDAGFIGLNFAFMDGTAALRGGQVISLHVDRPVEMVTITADGEPPATASPSYPDDVGTRP